MKQVQEYLNVDFAKVRLFDLDYTSQFTDIPETDERLVRWDFIRW